MKLCHRVVCVAVILSCAAGFTPRPPPYSSPLDRAEYAAFTRALVDALAAEKIDDALGTHRVTRSRWTESFVGTGRWEDCGTDVAYCRYVAERWWSRHYGDALKGKRWEVLARAWMGGRGREDDASTVFFWHRVRDRMRADGYPGVR
jgi:hypothetical protein